MKLAALHLERVLGKVFDPVRRVAFGLLSQDYLQTKLKQTALGRRSKFFPDGFPGLGTGPDLSTPSPENRPPEAPTVDGLLGTASSQLSVDSAEDFSASNTTQQRNPSPSSKVSKQPKDSASISSRA